MRTETPTQRLASVLIGEPVVPWIRQRRDAGKPWRTVAEDLRVMTKGEVNLPHQTLVQWVERAERDETPVTSSQARQAAAS